MCLDCGSSSVDCGSETQVVMDGSGAAQKPYFQYPLFALVKLALSIFCKERSLFRIKNYPRKLSRLSKIGLLDLSGALQREFFYSKIINILH